MKKTTISWISQDPLFRVKSIKSYKFNKDILHSELNIVAVLLSSGTIYIC